MGRKKSEATQILAEDPGNPIFAEYADELRISGDDDQAIFICLSGLSYNPACHRGRLLLARLFYRKGLLPFAIRELRELHDELPENEAIQKLLDKLSPESMIEDAQTPSIALGQEDTVAEAEFDFEELDLIDEDE